MTVTVKGQFAPMTAACIENAVKGAHFRASTGLAADYVFLFRRIDGGKGHVAPDGGMDGRRDIGVDGAGDGGVDGQAPSLF